MTTDTAVGSKDIKALSLLNPTSIGLGDFVINPYVGCEYACLYCYARFDKRASRDKRPWGMYVDPKINAPELLEKEIKDKKPVNVLLGSTTECFQPLEMKYGITRQILAILNKHNVRYHILTRSPMILEYLPYFKAGNCSGIHFTCNYYDDPYKEIFEPCTPSFEDRIIAINTLLEEGINVIPYISPVLPFITDVEILADKLKNFQYVELEVINFQLGNIFKIIEELLHVNFEIGKKYELMKNNGSYYSIYTRELNEQIGLIMQKNNLAFRLYCNDFNAFFENNYTNLTKTL